MPDDFRAELAALSRAVRAHIEQEVELGNHGIPAFVGTLPQPARADSPSASASATPAGPPPQAPSTPSAQPAPTAAAAPMLAPPTASIASADAPNARPAVPDVPGSPDAPDVPASALSREDRDRRLAELATSAAACRECVLHEQRTKNVFARGSADAQLVFVGEGPGRDEDLQGLPFVGKAGQLLDKMIAAMGFTQGEIYICNVVKCRPPDNRTPRPEEAVACSRFLNPQLELVAPKVIVALGRCAAENLGVAQPEGSWRGRWGVYRGIPVLPTYHPAFLLRSPQFKRVVWEDLQQVMARFGKAPTPRGSGEPG